VKRDVLNKLRDLYAPVAAENYERLAAEFNAIADKFAAACAVIDPKRDPATMLDETDKVRGAFMDAQLLSHQLTAKSAVLQAAATLSGTRIAREEELLGLTVDPADLHRRRVYEAWNYEGGRTGRFGALVSLGARIRAAELSHFIAYRKPQPLQEKWVPRGYGHRRVIIDPEDEQHVEVPA
jgi:hypothetical protein